MHSPTWRESSVTLDSIKSSYLCEREKGVEIESGTVSQINIYNWYVALLIATNRSCERGSEFSEVSITGDFDWWFALELWSVLFLLITTQLQVEAVFGRWRRWHWRGWDGRLPVTFRRLFHLRIYWNLHI